MGSRGLGSGGDQAMTIPFDIRVYVQGKPVEVESVSITCMGLKPYDSPCAKLEIKVNVPWALGGEPPKDYIGPKIKIRTRKGGENAE
jgi:hypothetical protein